MKLLQNCVGLFYLNRSVYLHTYLLHGAESFLSSYLVCIYSRNSCISRNPKVHYRTHKHTPPVSILGQPNPVHMPHPTSWRSSLILYTHLHLGLPSGLFPLRFPHQDPIHPPLLTHTLHMPSPSPSPFAFCAMLPLETLPPPENRMGEYFTSGLFCLQSKHLTCECFLTMFFTGRGC